MKHAMKATFRWIAKSYGTVGLSVLGIVGGVYLLQAITIGITGEGMASNITGSSFTAIAMLFILGIVAVRENLRLCNQFGVSRNTVYISDVISMAVLSLLVSALVHGITYAAKAIFADYKNIWISELYGLFFYEYGIDPPFSVSFLLTSICFSAVIGFAMSILGQFFSLLFWRMHKTWMIVCTALAIPLVLNGVPIATSYSPAKPMALAVFDWMGQGPWNVMLGFLLLAAVFLGINFLLLRKIQIRSSK